MPAQRFTFAASSAYVTLPRLVQIAILSPRPSPMWRSMKGTTTLKRGAKRRPAGFAGVLISTVLLRMAQSVFAPQYRYRHAAGRKIPRILFVDNHQLH